MTITELYKKNRKKFAAHIAFNIAKAKKRYDDLGLDFKAGSKRGQWFTQARLELENCVVIIEVHDDYDYQEFDDPGFVFADTLAFLRRTMSRHEAWLQTKKIERAEKENKNTVSAACGIVTYIESLENETLSACWGYAITEHQDWFNTYYAEILEHIDESLRLFERETTEARRYANSC